MSDRHERQLDAKYRESFGYRAGYLPRDRGAVTPWLRRMREQAHERRRATPDERFGPAVAAFAKLLHRDAVVRMYINEMIEQVPEDHRTIHDLNDLLVQLDHITRLAPEWETDKSRRNFFPISALFTYMMMTPAGEAAFRNTPLNDALRAILKAWCEYLDSSASISVLNTGPNGWLSEPALKYNEIDQFVIPDRGKLPGWGWPSFNAFFHREIKPEARPIADPGDAKVIVSPNDGSVYRIARNVSLRDRFWLKSQPYSLAEMLLGKHLELFTGGDVFQSYLSGADYHRWHSPVDGTVAGLTVIDGLMFSNLESEGNDIKGTGSQGYYTAVNTRGLAFIKADDPAIGVVCVMPVGITEISSIRHTVAMNQRVKKGQEIGRFSYGGSSLAILFQPGAVGCYTVVPPYDPDKPVKIKVNAQIATAR